MISKYETSRIQITLEHASPVFLNPARVMLSIKKGINLWGIDNEWSKKVLLLLDNYMKLHPEHDPKDLPEPCLDNFPEVYKLDGGDEWLKTWNEIKSISRTE